MLIAWPLLDIRQRSGYLFLAVMLGHILLISAQVNSKSGVPILEAVTFGVFSEVQRGLSGGCQRRPPRLERLRRPAPRCKVENEALKRELAAAQIAVQEQRALADRTRELEQLLELREQSGR